MHDRDFKTNRKRTYGKTKLHVYPGHVRSEQPSTIKRGLHPPCLSDEFLVSCKRMIETCKRMIETFAQVFLFLCVYFLLLEHNYPVTPSLYHCFGVL